MKNGYKNAGFSKSSTCTVFDLQLPVWAAPTKTSFVYLLPLLSYLTACKTYPSTCPPDPITMTITGQETLLYSKMAIQRADASSRAFLSSKTTKLRNTQTRYTQVVGLSRLKSEGQDNA